jgi:alanyl-tRNA synthetase
MTERLYYHDSYLRQFAAHAVECAGDGRTVYLDRTAFYPTSGGQPFDLGSIAGVAVREVVDEGGRIAHLLAAPLTASSTGALPEMPVECAIDWNRRFDHMQQHTGQHLLSAVFEELFHLRTVSFHLGADSATIDLEGGAVNDGKADGGKAEGGKVDARIAAAVEARANEIVWENRRVEVSYEDADSVQGLRKASDREGTLRIVSIDGLDRSACGGTHVRATGEIGAVLLRKLEKVRQTVRVEFLCGGRAVRRARGDYEALTRVAQLFSASLDEAPGMVATQLETARTADKARRKLELDLAAYQGRELYQNTAPGPDGVRRLLRHAQAGSLDELRALAQNFTAQSQAIFVATLGHPPSVLLATSADSGIDAGQKLKAALTEAGGRGGGTARMAQGSVPDSALLEKVVEKL